MTPAASIAGRLEGIFAPVVTPFDDRSGEVDVAAFVRNLRAHAGAGVRGVIVAGSTGEAPLLDEAERRALVSAARETLPTDRLVVAGVGAESTRTSLRLARQAAESGADAVIVVAPHYYGDAMTHAALSAHFVRLADESPRPVVLYSIPKYMHFVIPPPIVHELAAHENVVGIKDSAGDIELLDQYLASQGPSFRVLTGSGSTFAQALEHGAAGGILAVSTFAATLTFELYDSARRGDASAAAAAQQRLTPLASTIVGALGVPGVKAALDEVGLIGGNPRLPLLPVATSERARIGALLRTAAQTAAV